MKLFTSSPLTIGRNDGCVRPRQASSKSLSIVVAAMIVVLVFMISELRAQQKSYIVGPIDSHVYISDSVSSSKTCSLNVVETITYNVTGPYSEFARAIPKKMATAVPRSSYNAEMLTPGYSVRTTSITSNSDAFFIKTFISPTTPSDQVTSIQIKMTYTVEGSIWTQNDANFASFSFKYNTDVRDVTCTFHFDLIINSFNSSTDILTTSSEPISKTDNSVTFLKKNTAANNEFYPFVTFTKIPQLSSCKDPSNESMILIIILVCTIVPFFICVIVTGVVLGLMRGKIPALDACLDIFCSGSGSSGSRGHRRTTRTTRRTGGGGGSSGFAR